MVPSSSPTVAQPSLSPTMEITCVGIDFSCDTEFDGSYNFIESRQSWVARKGEVYSTTWPDSLDELSGRHWVFDIHSRNEVLVSDKWVSSYPESSRWYVVDFKTFEVQGEILCPPETFVCHQTVSPSVSPSSNPISSEPSEVPTFASPTKAPQTEDPTPEPTTGPSDLPSASPSLNPSTSDPTTRPTGAPDISLPSVSPSHPPSGSPSYRDECNKSCGFAV